MHEDECEECIEDQDGEARVKDGAAAVYVVEQRSERRAHKVRTTETKANGDTVGRGATVGRDVVRDIRKCQREGGVEKAREA